MIKYRAILSTTAFSEVDIEAENLDEAISLARSIDEGTHSDLAEFGEWEILHLREL